MGTIVAAANTSIKVVQKDETQTEPLSPRSKELVIGLVGYGGAGCSAVAKALHVELEKRGFEGKYIKLSELIEAQGNKGKDGAQLTYKDKLARAQALQNVGDEIRSKYGRAAVASLAVSKIIEQRGGKNPGESKIAFILDSIKHPEEVEFFRRVYDRTFRLVAVHADQDVRLKRLHGSKGGQTKFAGASIDEVLKFLARDEDDASNDRGQHVRSAFYLADYFIDNNVKAAVQDIDSHFAQDIDRFLSLLLGTQLVRPTSREVGMYFAHVASLQSACLSRQVGAALQHPDGRIVATGTNEVPKFRGGVYSDDSKEDHRCFTFVFDPGDGTAKFTGCHNSRKKNEIKDAIVDKIAEMAANAAAEAAAPKKEGEMDVSAELREKIKGEVSRRLRAEDAASKIPYVKDLIEFSRSVHAEMNAIINAGRNGSRTDDHILYTTTYPCHNCARHILAAGVREVYFIEPYVKSLSVELHSDAIKNSAGGGDNKMLIAAFTGVGPRMYEDYFQKAGELKDKKSGAYTGLVTDGHIHGVRLFEIGQVEQQAAILKEVK